eukprot:SAG22_NODE_227_length_14641_cov_11.007908_10_plen_83_part_00
MPGRPARDGTAAPGVGHAAGLSAGRLPQHVTPRSHKIYNQSLHTRAVTRDLMIRPSAAAAAVSTGRLRRASVCSPARWPRSS